MIIRKPKILSAVLLASLISLTIAQDVSAAPVTGFKAGRIIEDAIFTNHSTMSIAEIQNFFNSKVPNCDTNGTQPASEYGRPDLTHAQYAAMRGWQAPPYICLKNYSQSGKSAARIVYEAAREFRINPQVLIVLLQKEQGLVTDTWPLNIQYRTATGYGCPDTAPCDSEYYGFTNQVRWAARMFRAIHNNSPTWYTPYVLGNNRIYWHPDLNRCGYTTVNIENQSTRALYNYTPYRPNQASLNSWPGTGDSCSSYGNRNFYQYFKEWFGNPNAQKTYSVEILSKRFFTDAARTQEVLGTTINVAAGQKIYATITVRNNGALALDQSFTRLATVEPRNRNSPFTDSSWLSSSRPARLDQASISPGQDGTFKFSLTAPTGRYGGLEENFGVVAEGKDRGWMDQDKIKRILKIPSPHPSLLLAGERLYKGDSLTSKNGKYRLIMQHDGNLVIYSPTRAIWATGTNGKNGRSLVMQGDGNLVEYSPTRVLWSSRTNGNGRSTLSMQDDGNLVIYSNGKPTWASHTAGRR